MIIKGKSLCAVVLFFSLAWHVSAQSAPEAEGVTAEAVEGVTAEDTAAEDTAAEDTAAEEEGLTEAKVIDMDIRTSTLPELAAWCRSLGLSEGGGKDELAGRLRDYYNLETPAPSSAEAGEKARSIIIESARSTEYFTLDIVDEEYARLRGDVIVSLKEGDATHRISAQEILYNRTRNQITARGNVSYIKEENDTIETFKGESISVNLDSWATLMMGGISERALTGEETTYRFAGTVISRSEEEVTILKNAEITNASTKNSFWSMTATKLWLLPGSDFALQNIVLKVGEVPIFYFPFFYYPADEVIFHPVLGYRSREGNFIQTTTYILGRPRSEDMKESSLTKILGSGADMERERQGIFLRSTGKKVTNPNDISLKILFDMYSNLGGYLGTELRTPSKGILGSINLSAGMGLTRDIMPIEGGYTPYPRSDETSDWNRSQFLSFNIPLRYRFITSGSISGKVGSLSWEFPYYSDPYVDRDFLNRAESMDWFRIIQEGAALNEEVTSSSLSSYSWRLNGRFNIAPPKSFAPYLTTLTFSNFSSTLLFNIRQSEQYKATTYSPSSQFYYPEKFTIYSLGFGLGGTPLTLGNTTQTGQAEAPPDDPLKDIGLPRAPWEEREKAAARQSQATGLETLVPPALTQRFDITHSGGPQFTIDYRINPVAESELQFRTQRWKETEDVKWSDVSSVLSTVRGDMNTSFTLSHPQGLYTTSFKLNGSGSYQDYFHANRDAEEFGTAPLTIGALTRIYSATFFNTSYEYSGAVRPLYQSQVWGNTNLSYSLRGLLAKSTFDPESLPVTLITPEEVWDASPRWDIEYGAWDKEHLDTHQLSANLAANVMDKIQTFTLSTDLPPRDPTLAGNLTTRIWISEFNANMRIQEPWKEDERKLEPLYFTGTFRFGDLGSLQQYMAYDIEKNEYTTLRTTFSFWGFSAGFTAVHGVPYKFNYQNSVVTGPDGWVQQGDAQLHPQSLNFGFVKAIPLKQFWQDRFSFTFNTNSSLSIDLQRYTYSRFNTSFGITLGIKNFLDLTLSANSENAVIYRYLRNMPGFDLPIATSGEANVFKDLLNSFRFDDEQLRTASGFKLRSFSLNAAHYMGDWNATLGITLSPYLENPTGTRPYYKFNTQIAFLVQWLPISEIKTDITIDKDQWVFK
jgi:lipopolysaccharide assembly outer membrane protein LptD (OstA)